ncbi:hypothetical protein [Microbacterium aureliae]
MPSVFLAILKWTAIALGGVLGLAVAAYVATVLGTRREVYHHYGT